MFCCTAQVSHQVCQFFGHFCVSSCACDYGGYKQGCRLLSASHIGHIVIRKEEKKAQNVEFEVVFEKEYIMR
jgi:hypothetical protein